LISRIQQGDGEALWILHSRHADLLRDVIARCLPEEEDCEDVLREVFEDIRDCAVHYNGEYGKALGWMITLARRRALQRASEIAHRPAQPVRAREENVEADEAALTFSALRSWLKQALRPENLRCR
jgi:DNA-directed RNA polymerase specialized sigma24 family protein